MKKEDGRKMTKVQLSAARHRAINLLKAGWLQTEVAQAVGLHERTVRPWGQFHREHGLAALVKDERGRAVGDGRTLTPAQEKELQKLITDRLPDQLKLSFALWTRRAVSQLILNRYGIKLPVRTMGGYLKRWGCTPQKPLKKAYEQKPKVVREWLAETYPLIAASAKAEGAEIFWGDQTGVNNQPNVPPGLRAARSDAGGEPTSQTLWVLRHERGDEQRQCAVDGLSRGAGLRPAERVPDPTDQASGRKKGLSDPRPPARASQCSGESLAGAAPQGNRRAPSAYLEPVPKIGFLKTRVIRGRKMRRIVLRRDFE